MTDIIINLFFSQYCALLPTYCHSVSVWRLLNVGNSPNICTYNRQAGEIKSRRMMWGVHNHFQGSSPTSQALKTLKVMHFQRIAYWKQPCMIRRCPHNLIAALTLCSTLNSVRKVKEVSGQSVAHLNWPSATCCSTCSSPPHTERYCPLLTAVWHWRLERCCLIKVYFINENENDRK